MVALLLPSLLQAKQEPKLLQLVDDIFEACVEQVGGRRQYHRVAPLPACGSLYSQLSCANHKGSCAVKWPLPAATRNT
jgi:hypothetical protein